MPNLTEVLSQAQALPRQEQLFLIAELASALQRTEPSAREVVPGQAYEVWSPDSAYAAAEEMLNQLQTAENRP